MTVRNEHRARWRSVLYCTEPADRARAEAGLRVLYTVAGFPAPAHVLWYDSPCAASWALAALVPKEDRTSGQLLATTVLTKEETRRLEDARAALRDRLGAANWEATAAAVGRPRSSTAMIGADPRQSFAPALLEARFATVEDVSTLFGVPGEDDDLARAEAHFWGANRGVLASPSACPTTDFMIRRSFYDQHPLSMLADDVARAGDRTLPAIFRAANEVAQSAGLWWPYSNAVLISDRPSEIHLNDRYVPHREDGPAIVFRDGWQVFAWNGKAVPERWIMQTAAVPASEYRGFDPSFVAWAKSKGKGSGPTKKKRDKPASIASTILPMEHDARLELLRTRAGGALPRLERYLDGAYRDVWTELVALGPSVREEAHAADALAVAYETMHRVEANVRTLVDRLTKSGYTFAARGSSWRMRQMTGIFGALLKAFGQSSPARGSAGVSSARPHVPPGPDAPHQIAEFEKRFGVLPLSLRAFYEVVGEVDLIGRHPRIDTPDSAITTDPLVVYGLDEGALEYDEEGEEGDEGSPVAITIAPDDLHKANISGGDPYTMEFPNPAADGELVGERHRLHFVDYLRLSFAFGGFPGYEGRDVPADVRALAADLVEF
jgi:hypothetical protein